MKTQLIQLDPSDDMISVRDKMGWSQTSRILLVWPEEGQILTRRLELLLVQRHSSQLGAQLALVTQSTTVRDIAQELHIPVFENSRQAQNTRWRGRRRKPFQPRRANPPPDMANLRLQRGQRKPGWQEHPIARYSLFGISGLAILVLVLFFLPGARITLNPETQNQTITLPVTASVGYQKVNLAGELPARWQRVVVEGRASLSTSGSVLIPGEAAIGAITLTNLTTQAVRVPQGLIVSTLDAKPVRFFTTKAGVVSPGPGRTLTLAVQALAPGETGNLEAGRVAAIEGDLGLSLSVTNPYATHGGSDVSAPAPREQDRQTLLRQLTTTLRASALADLQNSLEEGDLLLSTSLELADTLEETYSPASGLPGDQLELTLRLEYQAMVVAADNLRALAVPVLDGSLAEGTRAAPGTLMLRHTGFSGPDAQGAVTWELSAQRRVNPDISADEAIQLAVGQSARTAARLLGSSLPLAGDPQIELSPAWWPRLPYLPFRIEVITE
jgi:hypothetical protein